MVNKIQLINNYFDLPFKEEQVFDIYDIIVLLETVRKKYEKFEFWNGINRNKDKVFIIYCDNKEFIGSGKSLKEQIYNALYQIIKLEKEV